MFLYRQTAKAEDLVNAGMSRAFDLEQSFTGTLASLKPPVESGERLMPGSIYVLVAAMAGSIVSRNRNILVRAATPFALGIGAAWIVLPVTMGNVSDLLWKYEQRFPAVADAHTSITEGVKKGWHFLDVHTRLAVRTVDEKVGDARDAVEGWVKKGN
jgi:organizing structure protein 2